MAPQRGAWTTPPWDPAIALLPSQKQPPVPPLYPSSLTLASLPAEQSIRGPQLPQAPSFQPFGYPPTHSFSSANRTAVAWPETGCPPPQAPYGLSKLSSSVPYAPPPPGYPPPPLPNCPPPMQYKPGPVQYGPQVQWFPPLGPPAPPPPPGVSYPPNHTWQPSATPYHAPQAPYYWAYFGPQTLGNLLQAGFLAQSLSGLGIGNAELVQRLQAHRITASRGKKGGNVQKQRGNRVEKKVPSQVPTIDTWKITSDVPVPLGQSCFENLQENPGQENKEEVHREESPLRVVKKEKRAGLSEIDLNQIPEIEIAEEVVPVKKEIKAEKIDWNDALSTTDIPEYKPLIEDIKIKQEK